MKRKEDKYKAVLRFRNKIHEIIFEADTKSGRLFDIILFNSIIASVILVSLDSVESIRKNNEELLILLEWFFTILFSIEYILRIISVRKVWPYLFSFYGIIDFLSIVPTYLSLIMPGSQYFLVLRDLRLLRIFRVLKLSRYIKEGYVLWDALMASRPKITVFLFTVMIVVVNIGALMYVIEGEENGFTSIPRSIYWAIVTLTTVGFGDIHPKTTLGQTLASILMILGYGIIAVPTGIVSAEIVQGKQQKKENISTQTCRWCSKEGHDIDAVYCKYCGKKI
ncbi:MAG: ion transporter [Spirochaetia bacterium]|nr:ion transporter [Spirochaetia bacterium]